MMKQALLAAVAVVTLSDVSAQAIIVTGPGTAATPGRNTTAPTGGLAGSGWDTQALFNGFAATPVSSNWFITANHLGNLAQAGRPIVTQDGVTHTLTGNAQRIGQTDIIAYQINSSVPFAAGSIAPLYTAADGPLTASDTLVMFGRGIQRGAAVTTSVNNGWLWGGYDVPASNLNLLSWGTNNYTGLRTVQPGEESGFNAAAGTRFLETSFNSGVDANEAVVALGDSGGGLFVQRGGVWKLVGLVNGVDGVYQNSNGTGTVAAYDARGLYAFNGVNYSLIAGGSAVPVSSYFSYLPDDAEAILAATGPVIPEPASLALLAVAGAGLLRRRR